MIRAPMVLVFVLTACGKDPPSLDSLYRSAYDALQRGDLEEARSAAQQGRKAAADASDTSWEWAFRVATAEVLVSQRKNTEVMELLDEGLARQGARDAVRIRALMTRGEALCLGSRADDSFRRASRDLDQAGRLAADLKLPELLGQISLRRGNCLLLRKDFAGAEMLFREALATARRERLTSLDAKATGNLGWLRIETGRYDEATEWLRQSLALATATRADVPRARTLQNLGLCYFNLGDYDRAVPYLVEAEELAARRHLTGDRLRALNNLGNSFLYKGDLERARDHYGRALAVAREVRDEERVGKALNNLGFVAFLQGRFDEAEKLLEQSLQAKEQLGDATGKPTVLLNQAHVWAARGAIAKAETAYKGALESPQIEDRWEAWSGLAALHVKANRPAEAEKEFRAAFDVMESSGAQLGVPDHRLAFFSSVRRFHNEHVDFLVAKGRPDEALVVADRGRARLLSEKLLPREGGERSEVARYRRLAAELGAVLLFYWTAPARSFVWVVTPERILLRTLAGEREIAARVEAYESRIQRSRDPIAEKAPEALWLYGALVGPIQDQIPRGSRVLLVPDGPLHQLNFETLLVPGERPHYWIEDVTLAIAPSLGLLGAAGGGRAPRQKNILVIGDPVSPSKEFPALPHAAREVAALAALFGADRAVVRSGREAKPSAYAAAGQGRFAFIHFAAHAAANPLVPLDSAVVLSGTEDSYKLYARDIDDTPLDAELVTLSACRSAGSRAYAGEGLVGLAWAFLGSGARNVIGGLWNVEDASTADLMDHLYRALLDGLDPIAALRAAKLRLAGSATAHRKPFYWAPFVVYTRGAARAQGSQ